MFTLDHATLQSTWRIAAVHAPAAAPEWADWLRELGFLPGEPVRVIARAAGGDPIVVRVGTSTFALRCAEAACIEVIALTREQAP